MREREFGCEQLIKIFIIGNHKNKKPNNFNKQSFKNIKFNKQI